jgi:hypothetical protein
MEVAALKVCDIDSKHMMLRVEQGKGRKSLPSRKRRIALPCRRRSCWSCYATGGASRNGAHHLELVEADVAAVGVTPRGPVAAEDARDLLCQPPIRRARLFVALHSPCRHLKSPSDRARRAKRHVQGQGLRIEGPGRSTTMTLDIGEFIRRFLTHVLPKGFHRIRHYGPLASTNRTQTLEAVRKLLNLAPPAAEQTSDADPAQPLAHPCPRCGGRMIIIETFEAGCQPRRQPTAPLVTIGIDTS